MLIDRYAQEDVFARVPHVATQTDPVLKRLDVLLEDDALMTQVKADLARRHPRTLGCGRHSTPVEVILRMLICKHLYRWSFQETEDRVNDSLILRWFCRVYQQTDQAGKKLLQQAEQTLPLIKRVIAQARARVLEGKQVAASEKVLSLFEPHTRVIPRHKGGASVEFSRQVELDEVEGGIITRYQLLSHPDEHGQALQALSHHQHLFGHPPRLLAGDRGVHTADTELKAMTAGVEVVAIPAVGKISAIRQAVEHSRRFRRGYRWRAGIEGRIASLRRDYGLSKCAYHGEFGMERWIGLGVIASDLRHIAQAEVLKQAKKQAA